MVPTPLTLHILLALARGDLTPAAIAQTIGEDSGSTLLVDDSALYKALKRLAREGRLELGPGHRRAYTLTAAGRRVLQSEQMRYQRVASLLRDRLS